MWTYVRWLTFVSLEAENHGACGFSARHNVLGCVLFDTVSNLASPLVRLKECCDTVASISVFFVWRLKTSSCPSPTDWLTVWFPACAMQFWPNFSLCLPHALFDVVCLLFIFWHRPPSFCRSTLWAEGSAEVPASICLSSPLFAVSLPIYPVIRSFGASRTMKIWSVPKTAWDFLLLHTNPSSPTLNDSPFTGWSIHRWLVDSNTCWHSQFPALYCSFANWFQTLKKKKVYKCKNPSIKVGITTRCNQVTKAKS